MLSYGIRNLLNILKFTILKEKYKLLFLLSYTKVKGKKKKKLDVHQHYFMSKQNFKVIFIHNGGGLATSTSIHYRYRHPGLALAIFRAIWLIKFVICGTG